MKKIYFILLIGNLLFVKANAQEPQLKWAKSFNGKGTSFDSTSLMKISHVDNSIYIASNSDAYGTANDMVLIKRDYVTGDTLWTRHYNGPGNSNDEVADMVIDQTNGDIYITGISTGIGTGYDIVTLKYSSSGDLYRIRGYDNLLFHGDDIPKSIGIDKNRNVYISGYTFNGLPGFYSAYYDALVLKYDYTGNLTGENCFNVGDARTTGLGLSRNKTSDFVEAAKVSNNGEIFVCGECVYGALYHGISWVFVAGLNPTRYMDDYYSYACASRGDIGTKTLRFPFAKISTQDDCNFFNAMDLDSSNNVYLATLIDTIYSTGTYYNMVISKIDKSGCLDWQQKTGGDVNYRNLRVNAIKVDPNNANVYATGYEKNSSGDFDWFVIKYNSSGDFQWRVTKNGNGNGNDMAYDIAFDDFQNPVVVGRTRNAGGNDDITFIKYDKTNGGEMLSVNYDSGNGDDRAYNIVVDANQNIIINGLQNTTSQSQNLITLMYSTSTGIDENVINSGISAYPNPTSDVLRVSVNKKFDSDFTVEVYDNAGVLLQTSRKSESLTSFDMDLSNYPNGVYTLRIEASGFYYQSKVIKK